MNFYVLTLFPDMIMDGLRTSITGRAMEAGLIHIEAVNIHLTSITAWMIIRMAAAQGC